MLEYTIVDNTGNEVALVIQLLDNPFVLEWKKYFKGILSNVNVPWHVVGCANNSKYRNDTEVHESLVNILASYEFFHTNKLGDFVEEIDTVKSILDSSNPSEILSQSHLNTWHRQFTKLELFHSKNGYSIESEVDNDKVRTAIQEVNRWVHYLEGVTYYKTPRRMNFGPTMQYAIQFTNANHPNDNKQDVWQLLYPLKEGIFDWNKDSINHTVWLNEDILGKDQMKAWLDHDDLTEFDCTGNLVMTPSIMLDPNKLFYKVLTNTDFQKESVESKKTIDRPALGDILNVDYITWSNIPGSIVKRIKLDDDILWGI